jgi:hypothetical protein
VQEYTAIAQKGLAKQIKVLNKTRATFLDLVAKASAASKETIVM